LIENGVAEGSAIASATTPLDTPFVEAQSWARAADGTVIFLADAAATLDTFGPNGCQSD
jgi:hypothetical protein